MQLFLKILSEMANSEDLDVTADERPVKVTQISVILKKLRNF